MSRAKRIDAWRRIVDGIVADYRRLNDACDAAIKAGAMDINGPLHDAIWRSFSGMLDHLDVDGWINWFIWENDCGKRRKPESLGRLRNSISSLHRTVCLCTTPQPQTPMGLKRKDLQARAVKRRALSRNQVAAKEARRKARIEDADTRIKREIAEAEDWARRNPMPKLAPAAKIRIEIPGMPSKVIRLRRWDTGQILAGGRVTTAKQFGRQIGVLLDQFL